MNCNTAKTWLHTIKTSEKLPSRLRRHLAKCPACAKLRNQLKQVEALTEQMATVEPNLPARARLEARLGEICQDSTSPGDWFETILDDGPANAAPAPIYPKQRGFRVNRLTACAASLLFVGLGWLLGFKMSPTSTTTPTPPSSSTPQSATPPAVVSVAKQDMPRDPEGSIKPPVPDDPPLVVRVAGLAQRIASDRSSSARIDILVSLADELRKESMTLAARGQINDLARFSALHDHVVRGGIVPQVFRLAEGKERSAAIARLIQKMKKDEAEIGERGRHLPGTIAERIKPLAVSVRDASKLLAAGQPIEVLPLPEANNPDPTPVERIVALVVRLSWTDKPLFRAEASAEMAQTLARATVLLSVEGRTEYSVQMGSYLDLLMSQGIADNLDIYDEEEMKGVKSDKVAAIRERAVDVAEVLGGNLAEAPPAAQKALQLAMDAARPGQERAAKCGKGPHKGKDKDRPPKKKDKF